MPDQGLPDFTAVNEARKQRVVQALLDFDWGNYGLDEIADLAEEVKGDIEAGGDSGRTAWAEDLAEAVMVAARPVTLAEVSDLDGKV
jgi:hypothetical protein